MSVDECFRVLGLPPTADYGQVASAFRRLAHQLHPDVNPARGSRRRFEEVVRAHSILREEFENRPMRPDWGCCPRCGLYGELLRATDGGRACVDCLLGRGERGHYLPLPLVVVAKHLSVAAMYAASIVLGAVFARTGDWHHALGSLASVLTGMALLAAEVLVLARANPGHARRRRMLRGAHATHRGGTHVAHR